MRKVSVKALSYRLTFLIDSPKKKQIGSIFIIILIKL